MHIKIVYNKSLSHTKKRIQYIPIKERTDCKIKVKDKSIKFCLAVNIAT